MTQPPRTHTTLSHTHTSDPNSSLARNSLIPTFSHYLPSTISKELTHTRTFIKYIIYTYIYNYIYVYKTFSHTQPSHTELFHSTCLLPSLCLSCLSYPVFTFFCDLLEEIDMWAYPVRYFFRSGQPSRELPGLSLAQV